MTEWLDLMLDEVRRKNAEEAEAAAEAERRDNDKVRPRAAGGPERKKSSLARKK